MPGTHYTEKQALLLIALKMQYHFPQALGLPDYSPKSSLQTQNPLLTMTKMLLYTPVEALWSPLARYSLAAGEEPRLPSDVDKAPHTQCSRFWEPEQHGLWGSR